jgi:hypothetical protein
MRLSDFFQTLPADVTLARCIDYRHQVMDPERQVSGTQHHSLNGPPVTCEYSQAHSRLRIIASLLALGHPWHYCRYRWWTSNYPVSFELWNELCIKPSRTLFQKTPSVRCRLDQRSSLVIPCLLRQGTEGTSLIDSCSQCEPPSLGWSSEWYCF